MIFEQSSPPPPSTSCARPLKVIWDNTPAHRGEGVWEYLRTPGLELRLVNPRFHEGRLCRGTARTSTPMRLSGLAEIGGHCQSVPGKQGGGAGEGRQIPGRAVQPERRGETALPDGPAIKGRNTPAPIPSTRQMHIPPWLWFSWRWNMTTLTESDVEQLALEWLEGLSWRTANGLA